MLSRKTIFLRVHKQYLFVTINLSFISVLSNHMWSWVLARVLSKKPNNPGCLWPTCVCKQVNRWMEGGERIISRERKFTPTSVITLSNENNVWQQRPSRFWFYSTFCFATMLALEPRLLHSFDAIKYDNFICTRYFHKSIKIPHYLPN